MDRDWAKGRRLRAAVRDALQEFANSAADQFRDELLAVTLFGSQARGEARRDSDIDLLVLVQHDTPQLREALSDLAWQVQFKHNVVITPIIRSQERLESSPLGRFPLYQNIAEEGIELWKRPS